MTEPDVALTDYGLAVENAVFAYLMLRRWRADGVSGWFALFFAAGSAAALAGGTVHGFYLDERTAGARILWPAALLAIGVAAAAAWVIGAHLALAPPAARAIAIAAGVELVAYAAVIFFVTQSFTAAVVNYLPAAVFLLVAFGVRHRRTGQRAALVAAFGLILVFVASAVQIGRIAVDPVWFNHNALNHVIQAVALLFLFLGARGLSPGREGTRPC
jgi:hypothetical protein